ncbi:Kelch repeat type 1-containing protein [Emticicia oligotrophica DSM 17448]|uniref:Kelch repeat type 1-containing protein n=1 Tax=Emticicia oligotrophica (strain DSM 17448 / CIP 109782 / MTCC 6937 / GPTSA100-15) TaxID=929562 RepID=A0ABN4AQS2_EMTOG|nr:MULTISPECIES: kelch repeat-containing protein [Emticicia]AFK04837.1 Kelch repeat type 1-containing protein [Emticicia oligotrophica DSM 17448]
MISKLLKPSLLISLFSCNAFILSAQTWEKVSPVNNCTNRHENTLTAVGDKIVLFGGRGIKPTEIYNTKTQTWETTPPTPIEIHHLQAVTFQNEVYAIMALTGQYPHESPIPNIYIYNPSKKEWRVGPEIPKERLRGSAGCVVYKNKIYLVNGITDGHWDGHVAWFDEYDPKTNQWKKMADAPHVRDHVSVAIINDKLYVAGGRRSTARINQVLNLTEPAIDVYDFKTNKWSTLPSELNLPTQRAGNSSVSLGDKLLVIGGESAAQVPSHNEVEAFDTKKMQWVPFPHLNQGRHGTGAAVINGKVYSIAGSANRGGGPELNTIEVLK